MVGKTYCQLWQIKLIQNSLPTHSKMALAKSIIIPSLLYCVDIFEKCDSISRNKLTAAYNNIARFIFKTKPHDSISSHAKQIFGLDFSTLVAFRTPILLHKIVTTKEPNYLFSFLNFTQSTRNNNIIPTRNHYSSRKSLLCMGC